MRICLYRHLKTFSHSSYIIRSRKNVFNSVLLRTYSKDKPNCPEEEHCFQEERKEKGGKYKIFRDEEASVIFDVEEERTLQRYSFEAESVIDEFEGLNLKRGVKGVFEIEDLVDVLQRDNAQDIFVVKVPKNLCYVEYLVVVSGKSRRHLIGLAEFIRKVYKKKKLSTDIVPRMEGDKLSQWIALDLGNIAVHLMSREAREKYDLESLWSVGPTYDTQFIDKDQDKTLQELLRKHHVSLDDFHPANQLL